jgi:type VI secretion system protein ImpK
VPDKRTTKAEPAQSSRRRAHVSGFIGGNRPLLAAATEAVVFLAALERRVKKTEFAALRGRVKEILQNFKIDAEDLGCDDACAEEAVWALVVSYDEVILQSSQWDGRIQWIQNPLQREMYGTHMGGVEFFDRLENLRKDSSSNRDVLEIYYLCMLLGYRGKYRTEPPAELNRLLQEVAEEIERRTRGDVKPLSEKITATDFGMRRRVELIPIWITAFVFLMVVVVMVYWSSHTAENYAQRAAQSIEAIKLY